MMQTIPSAKPSPSFVEGESEPTTPESESDASQALSPLPAAGRKLTRKVVKAAVSPTTTTETPPVPLVASPAPDSPPPAAPAQPWHLRGGGMTPALEIRMTGDRTIATLHLARHGLASGENPLLQRMTHERQVLRDRLAERVKAHLEATAVFRDYLAVRDQLQDHRQAARMAKATVDELTARHKRLEVSAEANLAEQLRDVADGLEDATIALAEAERSATVLEPLVAQRRTAVEHESRRAVEPAIRMFRDELKEQQAAALASLVAQGEALDTLAVTDAMLRSLSSGFFGGGDLDRAVLGE
jgi:hypothetical protein